MAALQDTGAAPAETTAVATAPAETTAVATYQRSHILAELLQKKEAAAAAAAAGGGGGLRALSRRETMQLKKLLQREKEELAEAVNNAPLPPLTPQPRARNWKWILDIETSDPDDVMMLLLAAAHPQIGAKLVAVTVTPGSREQVSLVRWVLREVGLLETVRIGARDWPINAGKSGARQGQFYDAFGSLPTSDADCEPAATVLGEMCSDDVTLVTGAPVYNLQDAILAFPGNFRLGRWVAQGGFAGEGVVPAELQMDKFRGMTRCATWNFGSGVQAKAARTALDCEDTCIASKILVSKNVCHRVEYDEALHCALEGAATEAAEGKGAQRNTVRANSLAILLRAMLASKYTGWIGGAGAGAGAGRGSAESRTPPKGEFAITRKKIHDPLALATALNEGVCALVEVQPECSKGGKWGATLCPGSGIRISIDYDPNVLICTLAGLL